MTTMTTAQRIRACYWLSADRQAELLLTGPEHVEMTDSELEAEARAEAVRGDIDLAGGRLIIGDWEW